MSESCQRSTISLRVCGRSRRWIHTRSLKPEGFVHSGCYLWFRCTLPDLCKPCVLLDRFQKNAWRNLDLFHLQIKFETTSCWKIQTWFWWVLFLYCHHLGQDNRCWENIYYSWKQILEKVLTDDILIGLASQVIK